MKKGLLFLTFALSFTVIVKAQRTVFWRSEAANGNWENGSCAEIGNGNSQWWYNGFGGNSARNRPDCFDGSTTRHNLEIGNNHETTMSLNTALWGIRALTFTFTATSSRTLNGSPDDVTRGISLTNGIYHNGNSGVTHNFNVRIGIDASSVTLRTNTSGAISNYNREIFGNANTVSFDGSGTTNVTSLISGTGAQVSKSGTGTLVLSGANSYTGLTTINGGILQLSRSGGTTIPINNDITVTSGTLRVSENQIIRNLSISGSGNLTVDAGVTLTITGTYSFGNGTINNLGTISLNGFAAQTFPGSSATINNGVAGTLTNLTINNSSGVTLNKSFSVGGSLTLTSGTLDVGSNTLTLNGPYISGTVNNLITTSSSNLVLNCTGTGPFTLPNFTAINNLTVNSASQVYNLNSSPTISGALSLTSGTLSIGSNTLTLAGTVSRTSGFLRGSNSSNLVVQGGTAKTLHFDQGTDGSHLNPTTGTNSLGDLTLNTSGNLVLGNKVNLYGTLTTATGTTLNTDDGFLVFRNTATTTARVADLTVGAGTISGTVRSEMWMHSGRRAWRFITNPTPISGGTIANNWQSNFGHASGYGTNIYGPSGGTGLNSPATPSASMMKFNSTLNTTGGYDNITNTNNDLDGTYFIFVRGDKSVVAVPNGTSPWVQTTLASKGNIKTGTQTINFTNLNGRYGAIPNPYLSQVDVSLLTYTNIAGDNATYHWNPNKGGTSFGGWETSNSNTWNSVSDFRRYMQTGQSALVLINSNSASVEFNENDKYASNTPTTQQTGIGNGLVDRFTTRLSITSTGTKELVDELFVVFKNNASAKFLNNEDAVKMNNSGENLSSKRDNTLIAIEARPYIQNSDSVFMNFTNTRVANYEFEFDPSNFDATVTSAKLVDKFLNNETPISLSAKTTVPFSVTATTGSNAADRFMVVFNGTGTLPNRGFSVTGEKLGTNKVKINWEAVNEFGVKQYELEHSTDGRTFSKINTQVGKNGNVTNSYTYTDNNPANGVNYYRIKTTQNNDIERYSTTITINLSFNTQQSSMVVYPNPVKGNVIGLQLQDLEKGMYSVRLLSIEGKEVYKQQLQVSGNSLSTTISPSTRLTQGTYTLQVVGKNNSYTQKVVVE